MNDASDLPDEVVPNPAADQAGQNPNVAFVVTSPPLPSVRSKSKERTRSHHRVSKKAKKKKGASSPMSPSTSRNSRETSTILEDPEQTTSPNQQAYAYQGQSYFGGNLPDTQQPSFAQYPSPPYQTMQSPVQGPQPFSPYQGEQVYPNQDAYQMTYSSQPQSGYTVGYSSRIEDVAHGQNGQENDTTPNQQYVRSQYIMARQDTAWRATR